MFALGNPIWRAPESRRTTAFVPAALKVTSGLEMARKPRTRLRVLRSMSITTGGASAASSFSPVRPTSGTPRNGPGTALCAEECAGLRPSPRIEFMALPADASKASAVARATMTPNHFRRAFPPRAQGFRRASSTAGLWEPTWLTDDSPVVAIGTCPSRFPARIPCRTFATAEHLARRRAAVPLSFRVSGRPRHRPHGGHPPPWSNCSCVRG
jgi:hypothetical protein